MLSRPTSSRLSPRRSVVVPLPLSCRRQSRLGASTERGVTLRVDDRILVQAAQHGDLDAFEILVRRHQPAVYRVALRMLGSEADAQDATQETFLRAWRALPRFRRDSALTTWLYRIVTRRCLNLIAARRPTDALQDTAPDPRLDPVHTAEQRARLQAVTRAIAQLPGDQRAALILREFEGLSYDQVADALNTSVPAIKGRLHRARLVVLQHTRGWR
jgi:RNA polymerase sigma-70 factor (ECF subfamily)